MIYMYTIIIKEEVMSLRGGWEEWEEIGGGERRVEKM